METEIVNKVANSQLMVFDLEDYYSQHRRESIDISRWLFEGFLLREKDFRLELQNHNWAQYQDCIVAVSCSTDAIVPAWANILVTVHLQPYAQKIVLGSLVDLETALYQEQLSLIDFSVYENKAVILKGCSKKPVPESAYIQKLIPFAKSIMFGEACSAVPLFKRK
jgi:hypothetical protein